MAVSVAGRRRVPVCASFRACRCAAAIGLTAAANVAGQLGDLAESAIKRGAGVKDSGGFCPATAAFWTAWTARSSPCR